MKVQTKKSTTDVSMNEYSANAHLIMVIVYSVLFGAWLFTQLS